MRRVTLGRLLTAVPLVYAAVLVSMSVLPSADGEGERQRVLADLTGPASYLLKPLGLHIDDGGPDRTVETALLILALLQALTFWGLLRWRTRDWHEPIGAYVRRFGHGPAIFRVATSYGLLVSAVVVWDLSTSVTSSGSMAGIWVFPLIGPAIIPFFALDFSVPGFLTFAGPVQAWLFWRLLRGRRLPVESE
ncbi:hypothetical protein [Actinomadura harenae]|uniref:Uncharacterized protein n=1 Tax=Actinomadura harenae TaxID=2483351 RepID=A0A3M2MCW2_9ACTN|nr:hypothetical protein [Actinomadura harenae]RMI47417.1 hypothetical protein EBO15_02610 [Actinomadura harenae]